MFGGGVFTAQNKVLPGAYVNFISAAKSNTVLGDRGIVAFPVSLDWGTDHEIIEVTNESLQKDSLNLFGYAFTADELIPIRDLIKHATKAYLYRINSGEKAACTYASARCSGIRGNEIKLVIAEVPNGGGKLEISTYFDTQLVDLQSVEVGTFPADNDFLVFKKETPLEATAGMNLTGGTNATEVTGEQYQAFLTAVEPKSFHVLGCASEDETIKKLFVAFTKRMREENGVKFQTVLFNHAADYEGVVNVKNNVEAVYWTTGACAGCAVNKSNTNRVYDGELPMTGEYTQEQLKASIQAGEFVFHKVGNDDYRVLTDLNSLVTVTEEKGEDFKSNQTVRVLDQVGNDIAALFVTRYLGKVSNDNAGRLSLWGDVVAYYKQLEQIRAIENFNSDAVICELGIDKKSVVVSGLISPVNCMEKLYMNVIVA